MSKAGTAVTLTALPLTAAALLHATPAQMAALSVAGLLPDLLVGIAAGVWIDRARRVPVLVGADLGRLLLIGSIPLSALAGMLTFLQLWVVAFLTGILSVFYAIAAAAALPVLVDTDQLVDANAQLATIDSAMSLTGTTSGGALIGLLGAPLSMLADAVSYLASAVLLLPISRLESRPDRARTSRSLANAREGIRPLVDDPILRALVISDAVTTGAELLVAAVQMLYFTRRLDLNPALVGVALTCGGIGTVVGSTIAVRLTARIGTAAATIGGRVLLTCAWLALPLASVVSTATPTRASCGAIVIVLSAQMFTGIGWAISGVHHSSLTQARTAVHLIGRVTAARRILVFGASALGAAAGGVLGELVGITPTLVVAGIVSAGSPILLALSPIRGLHDRRQA